MSVPADLLAAAAAAGGAWWAWAYRWRMVTRVRASRRHRGWGYRAYLNSRAWKAKRARVLRRDGYRCRACRSTDRLDVHHKSYARFGRERLADLVTLCRGCHDAVHWAQRASRRPPDQVTDELLRHPRRRR